MQDDWTMPLESKLHAASVPRSVVSRPQETLHVPLFWCLLSRVRKYLLHINRMMLLRSLAAQSHYLLFLYSLVMSPSVLCSWLSSDASSLDEAQRRAFILIGGPGIGKSTLSAALVRRLGLGSGSSPGGPLVTAYHFCKHADRERRDPVRMIKSLAYQLAVAIPALRAFYNELEQETIDSLQEVDDAFAVLLRDPLQSLHDGGLLGDSSGGGVESITILIDALDEAEGERSAW